MIVVAQLWKTGGKLPLWRARIVSQDHKWVMHVTKAYASRHNLEKAVEAMVGDRMVIQWERKRAWDGQQINCQAI